MKSYKNLKKFVLPVLTVVAMSGCTKLDEGLNGTLTNSQVSSSLGSAGTGLLLSAAYSDIAGPFTGQSGVFSLEENSTDESLVPTRGGDWDDNGVWRVIHSHTWNADHGQVRDVFNDLNKINFDATNVLGFNPNKGQAAEAKFIRALSLYYLLDLYGQFPFRNPGDNLLNAPVVKSGADAINFIISELTASLADLPAGNDNTKANQNAARLLLMKCYLNKGMYINRTSPTFDAADMGQVIALGNTIMNSGNYSFTPNYFDNFSPDNSTKSKEGVFVYPNKGGVNANHAGVETRWNMTLHYNSYTPNNPNAGWNGFSTISDFYNSFNTTAVPTAFGPADTIVDNRIGGRYYAGATNVSGLRPGLLVGQQYNENGVAIKDRKGAPLAYDPTIAANMIETGANLEVTGIRVVKYVPDYAFYGGPAGNYVMIFRYPDAVLMVAEAQMRTGATAAGLTLVNQLRLARGAAPFVTLQLVNTNNVDDANTFLAERGRELYWESHRRTDLLRFGVFLKPWGLKPTDNPKNLFFPVPNQALAANPNLKQNPGY